MLTLSVIEELKNAILNSFRRQSSRNPFILPMMHLTDACCLISTDVLPKLLSFFMSEENLILLNIIHFDTSCENEKLG